MSNAERAQRAEQTLMVWQEMAGEEGELLEESVKGLLSDLMHSLDRGGILVDWQYVLRVAQSNFAEEVENGG